MRKTRLLSLLLMAAMLATTAVFTACSSDDDAPEKDPNVIIAGENDPLGKPIGLVYTDFLTRKQWVSTVPTANCIFNISQSK